MIYLGQLIKAAVHLGKNLVAGNPGNITESQEKQLRKLLEKAKDSSFGIYYNFEKLLKSDNLFESFRETVPVHEYELIQKRWWIQQQVNPNITWPGNPPYFALTSGTTSQRSKRIPITEDMLSSFRSVGIQQILSLDHFDLPPELFEKEVLMLSSSSKLDERNGHLEGDISGINASNLPPWFGSFYRPGQDIAQIDDWDDRLEKIADRAPHWDVGAIAGIPSWVQLMLQRIIEKHRLTNIHEIWPDLSFFVSGGVAFDPYRQSMERLLEHPIHYMDTYLASEGFFAYTAREGTMDMKLAIDCGIYFEFIPFDERGFDENGNLLENPAVFSINDVEENQSYALLISTPAGAWRYMIGDTIMFTDLKNVELVITGRTKHFLNVAGAQLTEDKINNAITELSRQQKVEIKEFAVSAFQNEDGQFTHQWIIGIDDANHSDSFQGNLDEILKASNKNYEAARNKALKEINVKTVATETIYNWLDSVKKKGGQTKLPLVMKKEMMKDVLEFIENQ